MAENNVVGEYRRRMLRKRIRIDQFSNVIDSPSKRRRRQRLKLPSLPEDLILEILHRLPVNSLLQFKSVCKKWKTLISEPSFAKNHLRASIAHPNQQLFSTEHYNNPIISFPVKSLFQNASVPVQGHYFTMDNHYRILGSCNGLLCLSDNYDRYVIFWNPCLRVTSKPLSTGRVRFHNITYHGFGYDHVNDKYKLLMGLEASGNTELVTKIHILGAATSWKVIQNPPPNSLFITLLGKFVNGSLNWIVVRGGQHLILSFDFATETYGEVSLPDGNSDNNICKPQIDVLRNCLCVVFFDNKKTHWAVWLMKEYGVQHSWTRLSVIPDFVEQINFDVPYDGRCPLIDPVCISENGITLFRTIKYSKYVVYNSNDGSLDCLEMKESHRFGLQRYHESLVSPTL